MDNQKNVSATLEKRKAAFEDRCYEAYKFWWSMSHGMSQLELLETVSDLAAKETEKLASEAATTEADREKLVIAAKPGLIRLCRKFMGEQGRILKK